MSGKNPEIAFFEIAKDTFAGNLCMSLHDDIYIRVDKTRSLGPWNRVIVYYSKLSFCRNDPPMLQGPKDPVLPTLIYMLGKQLFEWLKLWHLHIYFCISVMLLTHITRANDYGFCDFILSYFRFIFVLFGFKLWIDSGSQYTGSNKITYFSFGKTQMCLQVNLC